MNLSMRRLSILFGLCFAVLVGGVFLYRAMVVDPRDRCESEGGWYDTDNGVCGRVLYIPQITGREPGESREAASERNAREIVEIERRIAAGKAARDADADRQRKALAASEGR